MSAPRLYHRSEKVALYHGDALETLKRLAPDSVDCIVTSPPYFGLRDYGVDGQIGAEPSPVEFVAALTAVFREARRVLADDGTLWLNLGDTYYSGRGASKGVDAKNPARRFGVRSVDKGGATWAKPKDLLGIPWRAAFALQDDGWILRNDIIWSKPNAMPESVTDRLSNRHEHLFMLTKSRKYHFDLDPIREPHLSKPGREGANYMRGQKAMRKSGPNSGRYSEGGKNPGDIWSIAVRPFPGAHFATMPPELAERCVLAGCKPGGVVLDPFSGAGTTGMVATKHGRRYIGVDLSEEYLKLSLETRLKEVR
jgi:DNA modification methylase